LHRGSGRRAEVCALCHHGARGDRLSAAAATAGRRSVMPAAALFTLAVALARAQRPTTCYVEPERQLTGRRSLSLCGEFVDPEDISRDPSCHECRARLKGDPSIRTTVAVGNPGTRGSQTP